MELPGAPQVGELVGGQVLMNPSLETRVQGVKLFSPGILAEAWCVCLSGVPSSFWIVSLLICRPRAGEAREEVFPLPR